MYRKSFILSERGCTNPLFPPCEKIRQFSIRRTNKYPLPHSPRQLGKRTCKPLHLFRIQNALFWNSVQSHHAGRARAGTALSSAIVLSCSSFLGIRFSTPPGRARAPIPLEGGSTPFALSLSGGNIHCLSTLRD